MISFPSLRSFAVILLAVTAPLAADPSEDKRFTAMIKEDATTRTTTVRVRIPKDAHATPVQSVYLQRASKTGLDLNVPVSFTEGPEGVSVYLMLPTDLARQATLRVSHRAAETGGAGSGGQAGEAYKIPLVEPKK
ncbi:hypothetical protein OKA04_05290 [Luteolibacter flavescens]|uniref:Uncharacterized protein n=1 Tax=Luteolibacter flavescens TaxID=1859460 RepID=A0ABT3FLR8_9BACT|nr:hypothetical protein [Luteolibacter flavescens]MCW1884134.1 hypothetical protein [Luteolibacter flavescens]